MRTAAGAGIDERDPLDQEPGQTLAGALLSALGLHLNWYEMQTTWLPASWDVLWSLSIEEVFYIAFPLVCLLLPRKLLLAGLVLLALSLPITKAAVQGNEIWSEVVCYLVQVFLLRFHSPLLSGRPADSTPR